jgi:hypothetical protein
MHDFWKIPITEMMYTKLQNYKNMLVDKHVTQPF